MFEIVSNVLLDLSPAFGSMGKRPSLGLAEEFVRKISLDEAPPRAPPDEEELQVAARHPKCGNRLRRAEDMHKHTYAYIHTYIHA